MYSGIVRVYGDPFYSYIRLLSFQKEISMMCIRKTECDKKEYEYG